MKDGLFKLLRNLGYSLQGLRAAWYSEWAFRTEILVGAPLVIIALLLPVSVTERILLLSSLLLVLVAELTNTAIETVINRISEEMHPLSGKAKDVGSAIVLIALVNAALVWGLVLLSLM